MAKDNLRGYKFKVSNSMQGFGMTDLDKKVMTINKKRNKESKARGELIDSITHEVLHVKHPKASEKKVQDMTPAYTKRLSVRNKAKLYAKFKTRRSKA